MPKFISSPTRCSVWEVSVTNQSKFGGTKLDGIWKIVISKTRIEVMESQWSSSGKYSQDSQHWAFSKRFKKYDWITVWTWAVQKKDHLHVNVQRHCMVRTRKHKKCETNSITVEKLWSQILARTLVIFWIWMVRSLFCLTNQMKNVTRLLNEWRSTLQKSVIISFVSPAPLEKGELRSKEKGNKSIHFNCSEETIELILRTIFL